MTTGPWQVVPSVMAAVAVSPLLACWSAALAGGQRAGWWRPRPVGLPRWACVAAVAVAMVLLATAGHPAPAWWLLAAGGAVLAAVDVQTHLLPARFTYPLAATITVALPWLKQATDLVSNSYLGGLLQSLTPAVQNTASSLHATTSLLSGLENFARCVSHNLVPTGNEVINDPPQSTGLTVYQELYQSAVGLAGAAGNFDGNGRYIRSSAGGGATRVETSVVPTVGPLYGNAVLQPLGTRPAYAGAAPPINRNVACYKNAKPDLNKVSTGAGP